MQGFSLVQTHLSPPHITMSTLSASSPPPRARFSDTLIEMSAPLKLIWLMQTDIKASLLLCYLHGVDWDILLFICFSGFDHIPFTK